MLNNLMIIINLFFVPTTGFVLYLKRKKTDFRFTNKILLCYILFTTWNIPITKLFILIARKLGILILPESSSYTIIALIASIIVYGCVVFFSEVFHINFTLEKKNE